MSNADNKAANARNAALAGAALAFAKPKPAVNQKSVSGVPSKERSAAAAASLAHLRPAPGPIIRPALTTNPSAPSLRAAGLVVARREQIARAGTSTESRPFSNLAVRPAPRPSSVVVDLLERNRSVSPSNIAAALAASRHSSISKHETTPLSSPQYIVPQRSDLASVVYEHRISEPFNSTGVSDVQTWLESIQPRQNRAIGEASEAHRGSSSSGRGVFERSQTYSPQVPASNDASSQNYGLDGARLSRGRSTRRIVSQPAKIPAIDIDVASPQKHVRTPESNLQYEQTEVESTYSASAYSEAGINDNEISRLHPQEEDYFFRHLHNLPSLYTTSLSLAVQPSTAAPGPSSESWTRPSDAHSRRHSIAPTLRRYNPDLRLSTWASTVAAQPSPPTHYQHPQQSRSASSHASPSRPPPTPFSNTLYIGRPSGDYSHSSAPYLDLPRPSHEATRPRTPSPNKSLRPTLRKDASSTSEETENRHKRKHFYQRKHPHKHHEGDRKRWRDAITLRERKRYEGVWATNRGNFLDQAATVLPRTPPSTTHATATSANVSSLIVRDIWSRSRLPDHVLEEVWELVDRSKVGALDREEFVVGMWLIDQRLKGRKLPVKVSGSVWNSVRGIYGIKVKVKG